MKIPPDPELRALLAQVRGKRARIVLEHIVEHGFVITEDLKTRYGYNHPPRAIRDVRDQGIPLERFTVKDNQNRAIAAYRLGNLSQMTQQQGRRAISESVRAALLDEPELRCALCQGRFGRQALQIDHRVPYAIQPSSSPAVEDYMLLRASCNRRKSWTCERCPHWTHRQPADCQSCFWANPSDYAHIGMQKIRRLELIWQDEDIAIFEALSRLAQAQSETPDSLAKKIIHAYVDPSSA